MTMPGRAVEMSTSTSPEPFTIVILERPACESLFSMCERITRSSLR